MVSESRHVAGIPAKTVRFSPVAASNEPPAETENPSFPIPVGTMFVLSLGAIEALHSPSLLARLVSRLSSTGLKGSTTQDGLATIEKTVLVANEIQLSNLPRPGS